jgi:plastocyanin domain-containing protein
MIQINRAAVVLLFAGAFGLAHAAEPAKVEAKKVEPRRVEISVTDDGFVPTPIKVKKGEPLKLVVTRKTEATCANRLVLDEGKLDAELPLNKPVELAFTPTKTGQIKYGCQMGKMIAGVLIVE